MSQTGFLTVHPNHHEDHVDHLRPRLQDPKEDMSRNQSYPRNTRAPEQSPGNNPMYGHRTRSASGSSDDSGDNYRGGPPPPNNNNGRPSARDNFSRYRDDDRGPPPERHHNDDYGPPPPRGGDRNVNNGPSDYGPTRGGDRIGNNVSGDYGPPPSRGNGNNGPGDNYGPLPPRGGDRNVNNGPVDNPGGYSNSNGRPRMPHARFGPNTVDRHEDRYVGGSGQSVMSHMTESVVSNPRMPRMMDEEEMELQRTQQSRGGGALRARSPPHYQNPRNSRNNNPYGPNSIVRPASPPHRDYHPDDRRGGGFEGNRNNNPYPDDNSYEERGMDDSAPPRRMLQRVPSQSTISTSGFRSFYSDTFTMRGGDSVSHMSSSFQNYDDGYGGGSVTGGGSVSGGASVSSRGSRGSRGRYGYAGTSRGYGGSYGGPPPTRAQQGRPSRSHAPRYHQPQHHHQPPPPPPPQQQPPSGPPKPNRPLLEVAPGLFMNLMGTEETMKAIQNGEITITSCVVCGIDVHCHNASEYVLCPDCRVVSPVNQLDNGGDNTPQQGGLVGLGVKTEMLITMMEAAGQQY